MARVQRPAVEWAALIDEWRGGGLGLPEFCRRRGLSLVAMQGWAYKRTHKAVLERVRREGRAGRPPAGEEPPAFLPVRVVAAAAGRDGAGRSGVEVVLGGGRRVAVAPGFDPETLLQVVAALEGRPC